MLDIARAEITNGIWLCRNCHKVVDRDAPAHPADLLFSWRADHERYVLGNLGSASDRVRPEANPSYLSEFDGYPPVVKRILLDKPLGWEWRLTAELLRYLNGPVLKRLNDLRGGYYTVPSTHIDDADAISWVNSQLHEMQKLVQPMSKVLDRLTASWGELGEPGDLTEIHHSCLLLRDALNRAVQHEEQIWFVDIASDYQHLADLLRDVIGSQIGQFETLPDSLYEVVALIAGDHPGTKEAPHIIERTLTFTLPEKWENQFTKEMRRIVHKNGGQVGGKTMSGFWSTFWTIAFIVLLIIVIF
ncbi:hypothetical protein ACFOOL_15845 [Devosia honganensis]|uniref:HNH endonuclease n=1 Tax=Devosia honganensis TaxID=1610527 RepID=A0ABV7X6J1_9HYPH